MLHADQHIVKAEQVDDLKLYSTSATALYQKHALLPASSITF